MRVHSLGEALRLDEIPAPEPGPGEVRLRVLACGLNFADTLMVRGAYQEKPGLPFTPGMEVCGIVEASGDGVNAPAPGTRVACFTGGRGLAEAVCAPASACVPAAEGAGDAEVAGFLVAYGTSDVALRLRAGLTAGETLLVTGAAGGVGLTAVELGHVLGARVIAVARGGDKLAVAAAAGADHLIDAEADVLAGVKALGGADVVYDAVGGPLFEAGLRSVRPGGRIIPIGFAGGQVPQIPANLLLVKNLTVIGLYWGGWVRMNPQAAAASLGCLFGWWAEGRLRPHVSHILPLEEANEGLELLRGRGATGKVVIRIG